MEDIGEFVSSFIESHIADANKNELELWCEAVYAGLFTVAFEILIRTRESQSSAPIFENEIKNIIESTTENAAPWINIQLGDKIPYSLGIRAHTDISPKLNKRLRSYFNEALNTTSSHGDRLDNVRSHVCFAILTRVISETNLKGISVTEAQASAFVERTMSWCNRLTEEVIQILDNQ
jgi:hypothetical protein